MGTQISSRGVLTLNRALTLAERETYYTFYGNKDDLKSHGSDNFSILIEYKGKWEPAHGLASLVKGFLKPNHLVANGSLQATDEYGYTYFVLVEKNKVFEVPATISPDLTRKEEVKI